jgi:uncharacterized protein YlxW (UPF0749 family)
VKISFIALLKTKMAARARDLESQIADLKTEKTILQKEVSDLKIERQELKTERDDLRRKIEIYESGDDTGPHTF